LLKLKEAIAVAPETQYRLLNAPAPSRISGMQNHWHGFSIFKRGVCVVFFEPMATKMVSTVQASVMRSGLALVAWLALSFCAASMGGFFHPGEWYAQFQKPAWNPPSWVFAPVWSALYIMMAISAWLIWKRGGFAGQRVALSLFLLQLVFNALWSPLFFGLRNPVLGLVDIAMLWLALLFTTVAFWKVHPLAGALLAPYVAWVTFAGVLNFTLWRLNP
jgi:tryptophan-rich sensory protein